MSGVGLPILVVFLGLMPSRDAGSSQWFLREDGSGIIHTGPLFGVAHIEDVGCWCAPALLCRCPEGCDKGSGCWRCGDLGWILASHPSEIEHVSHYARRDEGPDWLE